MVDVARVATVLEEDADVLEAPVFEEQAAADGADPGSSAYITIRSIQSGVITSMSSLSSSSCSPSLWTAPRLILAEKLNGSVEVDQAQALAADLAQLGEHGAVGGAVVDDDDLVVLVGGGRRGCCARSG